MQFVLASKSLPITPFVIEFLQLTESVIQHANIAPCRWHYMQSTVAEKALKKKRLPLEAAAICDAADPGKPPAGSGSMTESKMSRKRILAFRILSAAI